MFDVRRLFAALGRKPGPQNAFERGVVALDAGDHAGAEREFEAALADAPDNAARAITHNKRGVALIALGERSAALDAFSAALDFDERCAPALVNVGNMLLEDDHALDAIDYYAAAVLADATYPPAQRSLGIALKRLGRRSEAVRALRLADRLAGRRGPPRA
jgi:tetratricopeptide (TPR) repeat protein